MIYISTSCVKNTKIKDSVQELAENDFQNITDWMINQFNSNGIEILNIFHCPHSPNSNCNCRSLKRD